MSAIASAIMKILIVDDTPLFRVQLKDILNELGFDQITEAVDGRDALKKLSQENIDLVFLDWEMPNVTGIQVLNAIRSNPIIYETPIIMVTSRSEKEYILKAVKAGVSDYIVKPFDDQIVRSKLKAMGMIKE